MKISLLTLLIFFSCLSLVSAQKKYMVKVTTLDNKVYKGLMFQVRDKDFLILPNSARWDFKVKENNTSRTRLFEFEIVKNIKIRKRGSVTKGAVIGFFVGNALAIVSIKSFSRDKNLTLESRILGAVAILSFGLYGSPIIGGVIGGSYSHQFDIKKDSTSIQSLKTELKKYEWYHADKDTLNTK